MRQKIFTVEDTFKIDGRGIVAAANRPPNFQEIKLGAVIVLVQPEGAEIITEVSGIDMFQTVSGISKVAILIRNLTKEDVPAGTEVYLEETAS